MVILNCVTMSLIKSFADDRPAGKRCRGCALEQLSVDEAPPSSAIPARGIDCCCKFNASADHPLSMSLQIRSYITKEGRRKTRQEVLLICFICFWRDRLGICGATLENVAFLCKPDRVNYFIYRDRAYVVSQVLCHDSMRTWEARVLQLSADFGERLKVAFPVSTRWLVHGRCEAALEGVFRGWMSPGKSMCCASL